MKTIVTIISIIQSIFMKVLELVNVFTRKKEQKIREKNIEELKVEEVKIKKDVAKGNLDELNRDVGWKG